MNFVRFDRTRIATAASMFVESFAQLCAHAPYLRPSMPQPHVEALLTMISGQCEGVVAVEGDRLLGYMTWFIDDSFRDGPKKGAYVPEWGHAADAERLKDVYQGLYKTATEIWFAEGCEVHALTLLANNATLRDWFFTNGFGILVVDAARDLAPMAKTPDLPAGFSIRTATANDIEALIALDSEHCKGYSQPPILMHERAGMSREALDEFISTADNSFWLACHQHSPVGFIKFDRHEPDGVGIVRTPGTVAICGAYIKPEFRGQGLASAALSAALTHYAKKGCTCCSVNFEPFNPSAVNFWPKHFFPVAHSLVRYPERYAPS